MEAASGKMPIAAFIVFITCPSAPMNPLCVTRHLDDGNVFGGSGEYSDMTDSFFFEGGAYKRDCLLFYASLILFFFSSSLAYLIIY